MSVDFLVKLRDAARMIADACMHTVRCLLLRSLAEMSFLPEETKKALGVETDE